MDNTGRHQPPIMGAWQSYVNPDRIAALRVFNVGKDFAVYAALDYHMSDDIGHNMQLTCVYPTKQAALDEMDRLAEHLFTIVEARPLPAPDLGPIN